MNIIERDYSIYVVQVEPKTSINNYSRFFKNKDKASYLKFYLTNLLRKPAKNSNEFIVMKTVVYEFKKICKV